jgi:hypothetical protein
VFGNQDRTSAPPSSLPSFYGAAHPQSTFARLQQRFFLRAHGRYLVALLARQEGPARDALEAELWRVHRALIRA